ncbi:MAG TPA: hypothetical protein VMD29_12925 [Terracidiphilus sp.]|nr:hypothetical protein [Terracidiphilus sp.]
MMRWLRAAVMALLALAALSFLVDFAVFRLRGSPQQKLKVSHFISVPLNGGPNENKQEIDYTGSEETPCSITLYPQGGMAPCWYLRKHLNQVTTY